MLSPLVSWILASSHSSSSSSSSEEEEDDLVDEGDHHYENVGENEHSLPHGHELPSTSTKTKTKTTTAALDSSIPDATETESTKRRRIGRRQYQRLWTRQDEIQLLSGYLGYIRHNRWGTTSLQNDVTFMYDHIRPKLNMDYNMNQVAQKLRSLKRKHKTVLDRFNSGRAVSHRNHQEEALFEISQRIWGKNRDKESSPEPDAHDDNIDVNSDEDDGDGSGNLNEELKKLIEDTMRSCLAPLNNMNTEEGSGLKLVEQYGSREEGDGKERKQRILELEAYSKQLESLQDQIKTRIEELRDQGE